ncbi:uncharacterized protein MELLADRAFT_90936 [Melampsora larici-populina 98AG31]|uniref:SH3 domain-containing protein n=1 Tax=Melampsora larici-populina (strain 98AG31 / pathotype 3-4-7) TaxID=747676 RepID=F4R840_MELLP|nr:uncharacterized protein MELLADRAFT_90936 [Melampsora larici-populina 98AG31]EGG11682.1 hypothetical protein MELLADRAFT_90936 [Melampsora larici-populina 98AG31]
MTCVGRDIEHQYTSQLATLVSVNVVIGVLSCNLGIYAKQEISVMIFGIGWLVLSVINLAWMVYFTAPENSALLSMLNPGYQRKQIIRSSINLRRSGLYDDPPNVHNVVLGYAPANQSRSEDVGGRVAPRGDISVDYYDNKMASTDDGSSYHQTCLPNLQGSRVPNPITNVASFVPTSQTQYTQNPVPQQQPTQLPQQPQQQQRSFEAPQSVYTPQPTQPLRPTHLQPHSQPPLPYGSNVNNVNSDNRGLPSCSVNSIDQQSSSELSSNNLNPHSPPLISPIPPPIPNFTPLTTNRIGSALFSDDSCFAGLSSPVQQDNSNQSVTQSQTSQTSQASFPARALFSYKASPADPRELSIEKGEVVEIHDSHGKWWRAQKKDGTSGILPSNYVALISA